MLNVQARIILPPQMSPLIMPQPVQQAPNPCISIPSIMQHIQKNNAHFTNEPWKYFIRNLTTCTTCSI